MVQGAAPVMVPADFVGTNTEDWPSTTVPSRTGPAPTFSYGSITTIDYRAAHWNVLHTGNGTYVWDNLDALVATGKKITWVFLGTPKHLAQGYVDGGAGDTGDAAFTGPYGYKGEMSMPTDLAQVDAFWDAFMARYNPVGSTPKIPVIQLQNEPTFTGRGANFWWGTAVELVTLLARSYNRIKLRNPAVIVTSPGVYSKTDTPTWLDAQDPNTGLYGYQCCDAIAVHPYWAWPNQGYGGADVWHYQEGGGAWARSLWAARGRSNLQVYATEYGISSGSSARLTAYLANTAEYRRLYTYRMTIMAALYGYRQWHWFSLGNAGSLSGDMDNDTNGVILGITQGHNAVAGKTLVDGGYYPATGAVWVRYSDGTELIV